MNSFILAFGIIGWLWGFFAMFMWWRAIDGWRTSSARFQGIIERTQDAQAREMAQLTKALGLDETYEDDDDLDPDQLDA